MIDISKCNKAAVVKALYDNSTFQKIGAGHLEHFTPSSLTLEEAEYELKMHTYFNYLHGRVMKVELARNTINPFLYDRDNGQGAAWRALKNAGCVD